LWLAIGSSELGLWRAAMKESVSAMLPFRLVDGDLVEQEIMAM
jgi:hypothetical protein